MRHDPKQEITLQALEHFRSRLWKLPYLVRIEILALSIINHEREILFCGEWIGRVGFPDVARLRQDKQAQSCRVLEKCRRYFGS
jgi:hypothetical protein